MASRKIEVQLVGDASDLERSLASALAALKTFGHGADKNNKKLRTSLRDSETGLIDFGKAGDQVAKKLNGGPFGLVGALGEAAKGVLDLGGLAQKGVAGLGDLEKAGTDAEGAMTGFGSSLTSLAPLAGVAVSGVAAIGAALLVLPVAAAAAAFALTALLDVVTSLGAIVVGFLGPLSVLGGLLGLLGGGFFLAGQRAAQGGGQFEAFATKVEHLQGQFAALVRTLAHDFEPVFWRIANVAQIALNYFNKLAHMDNLRKAFKSLSTEGVHLLDKLAYGIGNVLAKPFRLAIRFAFDSNAMSGAISDWWTSLTNYLFGYTKTKTIHIGSRLVIDQKTIKGALDPIVAWFNRQHFTATGLRWSDEIIHGITSGPGGKRLEEWASRVARHAGHEAGIAFKAAFSAELHSLPSAFTSLGSWFRNHTLVPGIDTGPAFNALDAIATYAKHDWRSILSYIEGKVPHPSINLAPWLPTAEGIWNKVVGFVQGHVPHPHISWSGVLGSAEHLWDSIVSYIENHIPHPTIHINIPTPSIPSIHIPGTGITLPHTGGLVLPGGGLAFAGGGIAVGGTPGRDSVPALLTPGEVVLNKRQQLALLRGGMTPQFDVAVYIGGERLDSRIDHRVEVRQKQTAQKLRSGRKWS